MQEILPAPRAGISPGAFGELSRRLPSELAVQSLSLSKKGLVGVSSGPVLRNLVVASGELRTTSITSPFLVPPPIALRSFGSAQMLPAASTAIPSTPSRYGCATRMLSRHSVFAVKVASQPVLLRMLPS